MAYLGIIVYRLTLVIEMRNLTLILCGDQFSCERQADNIPARRQTDVTFRHALIPHSLACSEGIANRTVEVLLVDKQMIALGLIAFVGQLYLVAMDIVGIGIPFSHSTVLRVGFHTRLIGQIVVDSGIGLGSS